MSTKKQLKHCPHPGTYHLSTNGRDIIKPYPQADTCYARQQGYVVVRVEQAYQHLAQVIVDLLNKRDDEGER